jgi:hypothetical protein
MKGHRHTTPLRGVKVIPRPAPDNVLYSAVNYTYAGRTGHIHEVVYTGGQELVKVGFDDKKIVYYLLADLEQLGTRDNTLTDDAAAPHHGDLT